MMESLPDEAHTLVVERLREWLLDMEDEAAWDESVANTQDGLYKAAHNARLHIAEGKAEPLDLNSL